LSYLIITIIALYFLLGHVLACRRFGSQFPTETKIGILSSFRLSSPACRSERHVILLANDGVANHAIAQQVGLSRPTVLATCAALARGGGEALQERQKRKRSSPLLTPELQSKIVDTTLKTKRHSATRWTVRTLARHLGISRTMVHPVWQRSDIQPHRVEKFTL
jgi:transposase